MMKISPIDAVIGAEVTGLDLVKNVDVRSIEKLNLALLERQLLYIRDQDLDPNSFAAAAQTLGEPQEQLLADYRLDEDPRVPVISNYNRMGGSKPHVRATHWHTDDSYLAKPAKMTMLFAKALPSEGAVTEFINTIAVLDAMSPELRQGIEDRRAVHKYLSRRNVAKVAIRTAEEKAMTPDVSHPLVRTHPETGRAALYINPNRIDRVEGMSDKASDELLDELYGFAFQERFQYHHVWQPSDLVIWDNRCTMHRASAAFDISQRREFHRILLRGDVPK